MEKGNRIVRRPAKPGRTPKTASERTLVTELLGVGARAHDGVFGRLEEGAQGRFGGGHCCCRAEVSVLLRCLVKNPGWDVRCQGRECGAGEDDRLGLKYKGARGSA